jgi:hypothetical protein
MTPNPAEARVRFESLVVYREGLVEVRDRASKEAQALLDAGLKALFVARFGKRKKYSRTLLKERDEAAMTALYVGLLTKRNSVLVAEGADAGSLSFLDREIERLARFAELRAGSEFVLWRSVDDTSYSSMGYGATRYAKNHAEMDRLHAEALGIESVVRHDVKVFPASLGLRSFSITSFHVWVKVAAATDLRLLPLKSALSLKESVRQALRLGSNPRVMCPFLPHGYEASVGLDSFGNDIPAALPKKQEPAAA